MVKMVTTNIYLTNEKEKLDLGLERTREGFFGKLARLVTGRATIDDDMLDELEEVLITSDVGVATTEKIIQRVQERVHERLTSPAGVQAWAMASAAGPAATPPDTPPFLPEYRRFLLKY